VDSEWKYLTGTIAAKTMYVRYLTITGARTEDDLVGELMIDETKGIELSGGLGSVFSGGVGMHEEQGRAGVYVAGGILGASGQLEVTNELEIRGSGALSWGWGFELSVMSIRSLRVSEAVCIFRGWRGLGP
jgi:hypothetical protein